MKMKNESKMNVVNSYNEWDPLEEVIVGSVLGAGKMAFEPALSPFYPLNSEERNFGGAKVAEKEVMESQEQLDNFAKVLENEGIIVRRPEVCDFCQPVKTPSFEVPFQNSSACPRDVLLVLGDEIIEAPMAQRARYFEYRAYRPLIKDYFRQGAKWTMAPKPTMSDELYTPNYSTEELYFDPVTHNSLTQFEPCFDAATFVRCGKDIFYQPDAVTNDFGAEWLQRHVGDKYRIHKMRFKDSHPEHLDTTLVPIRPGLVLTNPERPCLDGSIQLFKDNNWDVVDAPASIRNPLGYSPEVSNWISMNVLLLDVDKVVVEEKEEEVIRFFEKYGYKIITCPFDKVYKFGGGFHCCSSDIRRRGTLQSYFPTLD